MRGRVAAFAGNLNLLFDYAAYLWDAASPGLTRGILIFIVLLILAVINILGIKKSYTDHKRFNLLKTYSYFSDDYAWCSVFDTRTYDTAGFPPSLMMLVKWYC